MKWIALAAAGLMTVGSFTVAAPEAQAQRYGWDGHHDRGWRDGRDRDERRWDRRHRDERRWDRGYRYRSGYNGWRGDRGGRRCFWERGYYGPVKRCYRGYR